MTTTLASKLHNPISRHWNGRYGWLATILFSIIGVRLLTSYLPPFLPTNPYVLIIPLWLACNVAILIWQIVGINRVKAHLTSPDRDTSSPSLWIGHGAILLAIGLTVIQTIDGIAVLTPSIPNHQRTLRQPIVMSGDGTTAFIKGDLSYATSTELDLAIVNEPNLKTIKLQSSGGHVFAARTIAKQIMFHELNTHIDKHCYSACTLVFMGGKKRTMNPSAQLGFHQYQMRWTTLQVQTVQIDEEQEKDREFFASRGIKKNFLDQIFKANHASIWTPDHETLRKAGVLTSTSP